MKIDNAKQKILQYYSLMPKNKVFNYIKIHDIELFEFIEAYYAWPANTKSHVKLFWIINGLTEIPKCIVCGKTLDINQISNRTKKYRLHCSHYCGCHSEHSRNEYKKTCIEKYGVDHNMKSKDGLNEYYSAIRAKYGVDHVSQTEQAKTNARNTFIKNYGVDHPSKVPEIAKKISESLKSRTDEEKNETILKTKHTKLIKYGNENFVNSEKTKRTNIDRYGVDCIFKLDSMRDKATIAAKSKSYEILLKNDYDSPCFSYDDYLKRASDCEFLLFKCRKCGKEFLSRHHDGVHDPCPECYPKEATHEEKIFSKFIRETCGESVIENTRTVISPRELDVFVPSKKIAFEFDGLYWHSDYILTEKQCENAKLYHFEKTMACRNAGIRLIHVFENEWLYKRNIVESRIRDLFGKYDKIVYARKCAIAEVDSKIARDFINENHMQGSVNATVRLGLFHNKELVALMTFGKCRFDKKHEWEMLRFCTKLGCHIPGAASKLLRYFELQYHPVSLISYADARWSDGNLYRKLGFEFKHLSKPNYWYFNVKIKKLESRIKYQKHKLKNILEKFDSNKTEIQNMKDNGYFRIFDCGNYVFVKKYN